VLGWLRLMRVYQKVDRASAEHLKKWGLSVAQFDALAQVGASNCATLSPHFFRCSADARSTFW